MDCKNILLIKNGSTIKLLQTVILIQKNDKIF